MSLCDEETVARINAGFVPCFIDDMLEMGGARARFSPLPPNPSPALRKAYLSCFDALDASSRPLPAAVSEEHRPARPGIQMYIVDLDGKVEYVGELMGPDPKGLMRATLDRYMRRPGAVRGGKLARYESRPHAPAPPGGVQLRVVGRYSSPPTRRELSQLDPTESTVPGFFSMPAILSPLRDWVALSPAQAGRLLPALAVPGTRYAIDADIGATIFPHFTTAFSALKAREVRMQAVDLHGDVVSVVAGRVTVRLAGTFRTSAPGMHSDAPLPNHVEATVRGRLEYEASSGQIYDLQIVTTQAEECTPKGFRLPFEVVAYRVGP